MFFFGGGGGCGGLGVVSLRTNTINYISAVCVQQDTTAQTISLGHTNNTPRTQSSGNKALITHQILNRHWMKDFLENVKDLFY